MTEPNTLDLAAEVARLKEREAQRDRAEATRLGVSPLPIPTKTQWQIELDESLQPGHLAWVEECARKQAHVEAETARMAPAVAVADAKLAKIDAAIAAKELELANLRDDRQVVGASYPRTEPYVPPVVEPPKRLRVAVLTKRGRK